MPVQMQQTMHDITGKFAVRGFALQKRLSRSSGGADKNFTVLKGDDIGGPGYPEKAPVDLSNRPVGDNRNFYGR